MTRARREVMASEVWSTLTDLVINHERKREVCEETGLSFGKTRALRRITERPLSMGELATVLGMDPPNVTTMVDDLQNAGLVERHAHPSDRRVMLVVITTAGAKLAQLAEDILSRPPEGLLNLAEDDLDELRRILTKLR